MAKTKISQFDANAANNTDLNSISIAEGTAPSNINNAIRELMSQLADLNLGNEVLSTLKIDNLHLDGNTIVTLDTNGDLNLTPNGSGSVVVAKVDINGGAIDGTPIGGSSASTGAFTTLSASSTANLGSSVTVSGGNIDGVIGANTPAAITGTVITANTNFAGDITGNVTGNVTGNLTGNVTGNVTGDVTGDVTGNITASSGTSTFNNVTINGTLDMDSTTSQTITGLASPSNSTDAATKGYVDTEVSALVDSAPSTLNTLNELAAALGDDASFSTTVTNSIAAKLPLAGGTMTGDINLDSNSLTNLAAPSNNNDAARKAYVDTADALKLNLSGGTLSGNIAMGDNKITGLAAPTADGDAARKKYVDDIAGSGTAAATSASQAATSATNAANSATASANSATAAASSATSAAASLDSFDDRYLGTKSSEPSVDNDGDALVTGALFFDTSNNKLKVWNGSSWQVGAFSADSVITEIVEDTSPQLGGDLDAQGKDIEDVGIVSADGIAGIYGSTSSPVTYTVTVASKTAAHPYNGDGSSSAYFLNGIESPALQLQGVDGTTANTEYFYKFDQSHSSNSGHPLRFYKDAAKAEAYTTGVTTNGTAGSSGAYTTIAVDDATPNVLYYECSNHAYMGNYVTTPATSVQGLDAELTAIAGLTSAADKGIQFTGSGTAGTYDLTSAGKALLDDADAAAQRTTLGLGTAATTASTDYATAAQGTKADNAAAKASNLSDLASASTARTNLGLGSAATLTAGTSANNAVQLDSNAKLPAVDGSQLTGISGGTDQIDMVVGTGSDAISVGNVVTRESNGETKKVKQTTATTNYTLTARDNQTSVSGYSSAYYGKNVGLLGMKGRYLHAWYNGNNIYLTGYSHQGNGSWTKGSEVNTNYDHDGNSYSRMKISYVPTLNTSAGGTFLLQIHDGQSTLCGNYCGRGGYLRILAVTVGSDGTVTNHGQLFDVAGKLGQSQTYSSSVIYGDHVVINAGSETCELVGAYVSTGEYYGLYTANGIGSITITYNGSSYSSTGHGNNSLGFSDNYYSYTSMMMEYDHTNEYVVCGQVRSSQTSFRTFSRGSNNYNWSNASSWNDNDLGLTTGYRSEATVRLASASGEGYVFFGKSANADIKMKAYEMASNGTRTGNGTLYSGTGANNIRPIGIDYSFINNKVYLAENSPSNNYGDQGYVRSYTISGTTVTASTSVNANQSPTIIFGQSFSIPFDKFSTGFAAQDEVRYFALYATSRSDGNNGMMYKSGVYDGTVTATTTNKLLAFGFAQKAGSAGDTISVLPFDSESIEQNQTSLTHNSNYYVTDTGTIGTSAGTDNVFVGKAIHTTNLRLPTKEISAGAGGSDPRVFCGAVDFIRDTGVSTSVILSKPDDLTASEIRAYEIHFYGVGLSNDTSHNIRFKPYKNGSSVMTGNAFQGSVSGTRQNASFYNDNMSYSSYLSFKMYNSNYPYRNNSPVQNYNGSAQSGKFNGKVVYENNFKNAAYSYQASVRTGASNYYYNVEMGAASATSSETTTDYAEQFYFYTGSGNFEEGVIVLYAIKK